MKHSIISPPVRIAWRAFGFLAGAVAIQFVPIPSSLRLIAFLLLLVGAAVASYIHWKRQDQREDHWV